MKGTLKRYRPPDKEKEKLSATTKGHDANSSENIFFAVKIPKSTYGMAITKKNLN